MSAPEAQDGSSAPAARGCLEDLIVDGGRLHFSGWMVRPDAAARRFTARLGDTPPRSIELVARPDLAAAFPRIPWAGAAGFHAALPLPPEGLDDWCALEVLGWNGEHAVAGLALEVHPEYERFAPAPPEPLMWRVAHLASSRAFRLDGLRNLHDLLRATSRHRDPTEVETVLDFGMGCGRITAPLRRRRPDWRIEGCDVDGEAIEWCRRNLPEVRCRRIDRTPPAPLPSASFDLIWAFSVFTHLPRAEQLAWLVECARLLRRGGLLVATVHGEHAAELAGDAEIRAELDEHGISDGRLDDSLDGVLPAGAYRAVFQTERWTRRAWREPLDLLDYAVAGAGGFQDVVVLRRGR